MTSLRPVLISAFASALLLSASLPAAARKAAAADAIASAADHFKDDVDRNVSLSPPDKDAGKKDVDLLVKQANLVKDHVNDSKPATADARQLLQQAARIQAFAEAHRISTANWERVRTSLATVRKSFDLRD